MVRSNYALGVTDYGVYWETSSIIWRHRGVCLISPTINAKCLCYVGEMFSRNEINHWSPLAIKCGGRPLKSTRWIRLGTQHIKHYVQNSHKVTRSGIIILGPLGNLVTL